MLLSPRAARSCSDCCRLFSIACPCHRCAGMHQTVVSALTATLCGITLGGRAPPSCSWL